MVLADFGADVVRVEPPGERRRSTRCPRTSCCTAASGASRSTSTTAAGRSELHRLVPGVDVVVEDWGPGRAERSGVGYDDARGASTRRSSAARSPGSAPPVRSPTSPADDALVMAKAGIFRDQPGWEQDGKRPDLPLVPRRLVLRRHARGAGHPRRAAGPRPDRPRASTSTRTCSWRSRCRQNPQVRWLLREGEELPVDQAASTETVPDAINPLAHHRDPREVTLTGMLVQCKDGRWIMHSLSEPHFFPAWIEAIGFDWIWDDERFKGAPWRFPDDDAKVELVAAPAAAHEGEDVGRVDRRVPRQRQRVRRRDPDHAGRAAAPAAGGHRQRRRARRPARRADAADRAAGEDPRRARVGARPRARARRAHRRGARRAPSRRSRSPPATRDLLAGPLDGITIVEAGYYYATPFATALLAELGARVIKIEPVKGDPYRLLGRGRRRSRSPRSATTTWCGPCRARSRSRSTSRTSAGARSSTGSSPTPTCSCTASAARCPRRSGIDEPTLRAINPDLVYQYAASYGSVGPYARQPAIDPVIAAFAGQTAYQTGEGNPPLRESGADPVAAAGHAAAMMLGLFARAPHRRGPVRRVGDDRLEHLPELRGRVLLRRASRPARRRSPPVRHRRDAPPLRVRVGRHRRRSRPRTRTPIRAG